MSVPPPPAQPSPPAKPPAPAGPVWAADVDRRVRQARNTAVVASTITALIIAAAAIGVVLLVREKPADRVVVPPTTGSLAAGDTAMRVEYQEYHWQRGDEPVRMIRKDEGFCYLTRISGGFAGLGESARVYIADDGYWYLQAESQQPMFISAMSVRFVSHPFAGAAVAGKETWPQVLARLAAGDNQQERDLAAAEKDGPPRFPAERQKLAELWKSAADRAPIADRAALVSHAIELYESSTEGVGGAAEADVAARLAALRQASLNDLAQWTVQSGKWEAADGGKFRGTSNGALLYTHQLPRDFLLEFRVNVIEGTRARIRFPGSDFYIGNEGSDRVIEAHGATSTSGAPTPYLNQQEFKVAIQFSGEQFVLSIDDEVTARGTRAAPPGSVGLQIESGDFFNQGTVLYSDFKLGPPR